MKKFLSLFFVFCSLNAACQVRDGLTDEQRNTVTSAIKDYMGKLCNTCRYPNIEETKTQENRVLPENFFKVQEKDFQRNEEIDLSIKCSHVSFHEGVNYAQALDELIKQREEKYVIDCVIAANLSVLQGVRALVNGDDAFNNLCRSFLRKDSTLFIDALYLNLSGNGNAFIPPYGSVAYFSQVEFEGGLEEQLLLTNQLFDCSNYVMIALLKNEFKFNNMYFLKHAVGHMVGVQTILVGHNQFVFFDDTGTAMPTTAQEISKMLVNAFNEDSVPNDEFSRRNIGLLNSIKYKDSEQAQRWMRQNTRVESLDFAKLLQIAQTIKAKT